MKTFKRMLNWFKPVSEHQKMEEFLSQATSRVHLEFLQREWDARGRTR